MRRFLWKWELWLCMAGLPAESRQKINTFNHARELFCQSHWLRWLQLSLKTMKNFAELPQAPSASFAGTLMNSDLLNGSLNPLLRRSWQSGAAAAAGGPKPAAVTRQCPGSNAQKPTPTLTAAKRLSPVSAGNVRYLSPQLRRMASSENTDICSLLLMDAQTWCLLVFAPVNSKRQVRFQVFGHWMECFQLVLFPSRTIKKSRYFCWMEINYVKDDFSFLWKNSAFLEKKRQKWIWE